MSGEQQNSNKITISFAAVGGDTPSEEKQPSPRITFKIPLGGSESEPVNEESGVLPAEECEEEYLEGGDEDVQM